MSTLTWDAVGDKIVENGLDRGVLYLEDRSAVAWNGLISVDDKTVNSTTSNYFNGIKYSDSVVIGDFVGTLKAYTYPEEFMEFEGIQEIAGGLFVTGQMPKTFGLSYRTLIGNDLTTDLGYKIHLIDYLTAVPSIRSAKTRAKEVNAVEFEWTITAIPSNVSGFRPTPHLVFDTTKADPEFVTELEEILYGTESVDGRLPSFEELASLVRSLV